METYSPRKWLSFINQENQEITKIGINKGNLMPAESFSVVLFLRLNRYICSHSSETYFWIEILKELPPRDWEVC